MQNTATLKQSEALNSANKPSQQSTSAQVTAAQGQAHTFPSGEIVRQSQHTDSLPPHIAPTSSARVLWDGRLMTIQATNANLQQILQQIAAKTGARIEGVMPDSRIFGQYGPSSGCAVIAELLKSSGYNLVMTGSPDTDKPLLIILSERPAVSAQASEHTLPRTKHATEQASNQNTPENEDDKLPTSTPGQTAHADQNPFANGEKTGDPLQFMDDVLHRQEKLDEQQRAQAQQAAGH